MAKWDEEKIIHSIKEIIKESKRFPSDRYLNKIGRFDLSSAIRRGKGFAYYRELLNCPMSRKIGGFWADNYESEFQKIIDKIGYFPSAVELQKENNGFYIFLQTSGLLHFKSLFHIFFKVVKFFHLVN